MKFKNRLITIIHIVVCIFFANYSSANSSHAIERLPISKADKVRYNTTDHYTIIDHSPEGIRKYKDLIVTAYHTEVEKASHQNGGLRAVLTTITFEDPLSLEGTINIIDEYKLIPKYAYSFAEGPDNPHGLNTGFSALLPRQGEFNRPHLVKALENLASTLQKGEKFIGFTSLIAFVDAKQLAKLQSNPAVFLADVSADQHFVNNPGSDGYMADFSWILYHQKHGIKNYTP